MSETSSSEIFSLKWTILTRPDLSDPLPTVKTTLDLREGKRLKETEVSDNELLRKG